VHLITAHGCLALFLTVHKWNIDVRRKNEQIILYMFTIKFLIFFILLCLFMNMLDSLYLYVLLLTTVYLQLWFVVHADWSMPVMFVITKFHCTLLCAYHLSDRHLEKV